MKTPEKNKIPSDFTYCQEDSKCISADASPFDYAVNLISGKWKMRILFALSQQKCFRYGELKRLLTPITHKMLSMQLKELERDDLIIRKEYPQVPPKVEYSLSEKSIGLFPVFKEFRKWMEKYFS